MNWEMLYLICFGVGLALSIAMFFGGLGHLHIGHSHIFHAPAAHGGHAQSGMGFFNGFTFTIFLCWFGGTGFLLTHHRGYMVPVVLLLAMLSGLLAASGIFLFLARVLLPHERLLLPEDTEMRGVIARVNSGIRAGGTGEILFSLNGTRRVSAACVEDGSAIARDMQVLVLRYERGIAWVRPWTDLDELHASTHTPT